MGFGSTLKALRITNNLTQGELVQMIETRCGVKLDQTAYSRYENSERPLKSANVINALAEIFGVSSEFLRYGSASKIFSEGIGLNPEHLRLTERESELIQALRAGEYSRFMRIAADVFEESEEQS